MKIIYVLANNVDADEIQWYAKFSSESSLFGNVRVWESPVCNGLKVSGKLIHRGSCTICTLSSCTFKNILAM